MSRCWRGNGLSCDNCVIAYKTTSRKTNDVWMITLIFLFVHVSPPHLCSAHLISQPRALPDPHTQTDLHSLSLHISHNRNNSKNNSSSTWRASRSPAASGDITKTHPALKTQHSVITYSPSWHSNPRWTTFCKLSSFVLWRKKVRFGICIKCCESNFSVQYLL